MREPTPTEPVKLIAAMPLCWTLASLTVARICTPMPGRTEGSSSPARRRHSPAKNLKMWPAPARHVREEDALRHVAGYCLCDDVSERAWQIEYEGQWTKGKSYYGYAPLGPWLVTADEVPDPQDVDLWLEVNGVRRQTGNTRTQIFGVAHIVSYLSRFMALQAGDVIATGTPPGVGLGHKPPLFLKAGDRVALGSRLLGEQRQSVVAYDDETMGARWREARLPQL